MPTLRRLWMLALVLLSAIVLMSAEAQTVSLVGLRSINHAGAFHGLKADADGNLYTLFDAKDGVRLLKFSADGAQLLAQTHMGQAGDSGVALDVDSLGFVVIAGISSSNGSIAGTSGTAFPNRTDTTTNSFVARFTPALTLEWLSFLGSGKTSVTAITSTDNAVYVTGATYASTLPVTPAGVQQSPAPNSSGNGFVESFDAANGTLKYATYLTGANGDTQPSGIVADSSGSAYVVGSTSATGFPTTSALVPIMRYAGAYAVSGFITKFTPAGDGFVFSTFVPGDGLTSVALDGSAALLASGNISSGLFPLTVVQTPVATGLRYQSALRLPVNGSRVLSSTLLAPADTSVIAAGGNGQSWVFASSDGIPPLLPLPPLEGIGSASAFRIASSGKVDFDARMGGVAVNNSSSATLPVTASGVAVAKDGSAALAGSLTPTVSSGLLSTQTFDLSLAQAPNVALPSALRDAVPVPPCGGSACTGGAGLLARISPDARTPQLALSVDNHPNLTLRNLGPVDATGLRVTANGFTIANACGSTLVAGAECALVLSGGVAGSITVEAANFPSFTTLLPAPHRPADAVSVTPRALNFGIVTAGDTSARRTLTVWNFSNTTQTFPSQRIGSTSSTYTVTQSATTCAPAGDGVNFSLAANSNCSFVLSVNPSASSGTDEPVAATWRVGSNDVAITGYAQAPATSLSATTVDFGRQFAGGLRVPRYLYLSNGSDTVQAHATAVSTNPAFTVSDECPASLQPHSVCRIGVSYLSAAVPSSDALSLAVDGTTVTILGETLQPPSIAGAGVNLNLSVSAQTENFADPVAVTTVSTAVKSLTVSNTGASPFDLSYGITGDFSMTTNCPAVMPGRSSCTFSVSFTPSASGFRQGLLLITAGSAAPVYVALSGTGTAIFPQNNGLNFGDIPLNTPVVMWVKVQQAFVSATVASSDPAYRVVLVEDIGYGHGQPSAGSFASTATDSCLNCWLGIQFTPTAVASDVASISFSSSAAGRPTSLVVSGRGAPLTGLILTPLVEDFGPMASHTSSASTLFHLTNATAGIVTSTGVATSGDFSVSSEPTGAQDCGAATLPVGASCLVAVRFTPSGVGTRTGRVQVHTSAGTASATLMGTATDDPGVSFQPGELRFDNVPGESAVQQTVTLTNTSNGPESIGKPSSEDSHFTVTSGCSTLAAGASCGLTVEYAATDSLSAGTITVPVTSASAGASSTSNYVVAVTGTYTSETAGLQIVPGEHSTIHFGTQAIGTISSPRLLHVNNLTSKAMTLEITAPRQFSVTSSTCDSLPPNGSCDLSVRFTPLTAGATTGTVFLRGTPPDGGATQNGLAYLEGYGLGAGSLSVTGDIDITGVLRFGQVASGQSATRTLTITNPASATTTLTVRRILSEAPFFLTTTTCGLLLAPGQNCTATVKYVPTYEIASNANLPTPRVDTSSILIQSDADNTPLAVNLAGQVSPIVTTAAANGGLLQAVSISQGSLSFANTAVGSASTVQAVQLTNTGTVAVHVLGAVASRGFAAGNHCSSLQPGSTCTISVTYQPQTAGTTLGALEIQTDSVSPLDFVSLVGTGSPASVALTPQTIDFGRVLVGRTARKSATLTNTGAAPVTISAITLAGTGFNLSTGSSSTDTCAVSGILQAGASCSVAVDFSPASIGTLRATLSVATTATALPLSVALAGVGTQPELAVTPGSIDFGTVAVGSSATLSLTLRNVSNTTVNALNFSATSGFTVSSTCGLTTLAVGSSCAVSVTFSPLAAGTARGNLSITSDDPASPVNVPLIGSGAAAAAGGFLFTVNGSATGSATVVQGVAGTYSLSMTPVNGFSGAVALTCSPDVTAQYAACSLLPAVVTLGPGAQTSVATISTVTAVATAEAVRKGRMLLAVLLPGCVLLLAQRRRPSGAVILALLLIVSGCGSGGDPRIRYTPAGTYTFHVTASSTTGTVVAQTVTLTLVVTPK